MAKEYIIRNENENTERKGGDDKPRECSSGRHIKHTAAVYIGLGKRRATDGSWWIYRLMTETPRWRGAHSQERERNAAACRLLICITHTHSEVLLVMSVCVSLCRYNRHLYVYCTLAPRNTFRYRGNERLERATSVSNTLLLLLLLLCGVHVSQLTHFAWRFQRYDNNNNSGSSSANKQLTWSAHSGTPHHDHAVLKSSNKLLDGERKETYLTRRLAHGETEHYIAAADDDDDEEKTN